MHDSAIEKMKAFVDTYLSGYKDNKLNILEIGSKVIPPQISQKFLFENKNWNYKGLDIEAGYNVDIVPNDSYDWKELGDNTFDVVISSQTFEHIPYFWITAFEIGRVLKDGGLACIIVPSAGDEHRFPYDTFRYFPDGLNLLCEYMGFKTFEVYRQSEDLQYSDGSDYNKDSCLIMQKPILQDLERQLFLFKDYMHKLLLRGKSIDDFKNFHTEFSNYASTKNALMDLENKRKKNITKWFIRKRAIKACIPILIKAIFCERMARNIFIIYPKMGLWN